MDVNDTSQYDDDTRARRVEQLRKLRKASQQRLFQRELQQAKYGIMADPSILIDIDEIKDEIAKLDRELKSLGA
jgi:hypothetical protein